MGMRLVADCTVPPPRPVTLTVTCDGLIGMFACTARETFDATAGHPRDPAVKAGWKITADGPVLCPECAGRRAA